MRYPLVPDEEPTPLERVLAIADSGSGASWELRIRHRVSFRITGDLP